MDGDMVLVSPTSHAKTIPPDDTLKTILAKEGLAGLIVVDQRWSLNTADSPKFLSCKAALTILDRNANIVLDSKPGSLGGDSVILQSLISALLNEVTFGSFFSTREAKKSRQELNQKVGQNIARRIQSFLNPPTN